MNTTLGDYISKLSITLSIASVTITNESILFHINHIAIIYILLHAFPCNTGEYCTSAGMYFYESEGRVKILPARVQYAVLHGNACNKRFILYSCITLTIAG